jgi:hypothetical protein
VLYLRGRFVMLTLHTANEYLLLHLPRQAKYLSLNLLAVQAIPAVTTWHDVLL